MEIIERKLKDIGEYINGKAFKPDEWKKEGIPIIRIENLSNPSAKFNYYKGVCDKKYHIINGDILLSWSATLDAYIWEGQEAYLNQHIFKVLPKNEVLDFNFSFFLMKYAILTLRTQSHGSTMVHVTRPIFNNLRVRFPKSIKDQQSIASEIKEKLATGEQMKLAALKQKEAIEAMQGALLREIFQFKEGDELPKDWIWLKLKEIAEFKNGLNYSEADVTKGIKIVGVGSFKKHFYVKEELLDEINSSIVETGSLLKDGDLVIVRSNGNPELVGRHILFRGNYPVTHSGFTIRIRLNLDKLYPEFYLLFAKSSSFRDQIKGQGSNISNLSQEKLKKVLMPAPDSINEQKKLADVFLKKLDNLEKLKIQVDTQLKAIEALPAAILREVFEFKS